MFGNMVKVPYICIISNALNNNLKTINYDKFKRS